MNEEPDEETKELPHILLKANGFHCPECNRNLMSRFEDMENGEFGINENVVELHLEFGGPHFPPDSEYIDKGEVELGSEEEKEQFIEEEMCQALVGLPTFVLVPEPVYDELESYKKTHEAVEMMNQKIEKGLREKYNEEVEDAE